MQDTLTQAKDLLDLVTTPSALVSGTLLAFASRSIKENLTKVDKTKMTFGFLAALAGVGITASLASLMWPIAFRAVFLNRGGIEATLVVYCMIFLSVCGTSGYALWVVAQCIGQLKRPSQ